MAVPTVAARNLGMSLDMEDQTVYDRAVERFTQNGIRLPTFAQLADPSTLPADAVAQLAGVDRDEPDPRNLFRVHWFNRLDGSGPTDVPDHIELPSELTGVDARIVLALGNRFPMIRAHKVLAAYACLAPSIVTGGFDPTTSRAIWPSTGNYARGGVAISRIMGCRGVAVLPEGMSQERFDWLDRWIGDPDDVIRTYGTESNVKEIYDACNELAKDPANVIFNQFNQFWNHMGHYTVTGRALEVVYEHVTANSSGSRLAAYISASGSGGTLGAGDYLKDRHGSKTVAVEALECPTMLYNGFGEHNIQGIGDKHIPLIHNVMNTDVAVAISDKSTDALHTLFNTPAGRAHLTEAVGCAPELVDSLVHLGFSSIANTLAAIKTARHYAMTSDDVIVTVATDGSEMYSSERDEYVASHYPAGFGASEAASVHAQHLGGVDASHFLELGEIEKTRIFNLGYFTWVEQQGTDFSDFEARRSQDFWNSMRTMMDELDGHIDEFNARTGLG
jgi:cysteine synthase A